MEFLDSYSNSAGCSTQVKVECEEGEQALITITALMESLSFTESEFDEAVQIVTKLRKMLECARGV